MHRTDLLPPRLRVRPLLPLLLSPRRWPSTARKLGTLATTLPFFAYTACFLLAPTVIVIVGAFQDRSGNFTLANFNKMFEANTIAAFGTSILVSLASSLIGAVVGALASYALVIGAKPNGLLRRMVSAISSVLAQFGGVMLAFAFIATIGINGIGTMLIKTLTGYTVNPNWLSSLPGLSTIYCYFQIPLMIIIFLPAVDSIRPQWREACESLGGNTFQYWTRVACPIWHPASSPRSCCCSPPRSPHTRPPRPCSPSVRFWCRL